MNDDELYLMLCKWHDRIDGLPTVENIHRDVWMIGQNVGQRISSKDTKSMLARLEASRRVVRDGDTWRAIPAELTAKIERQTQSKLF